MTYVVDAHVLIWQMLRSPKLSRPAHAALVDPTARIVVPTIALAEIQHAFDRGRLAVSSTDARNLVDSLVDAVVHPFDEPVLDRLPAGLELHDGIIVATALLFGEVGRERVTVVTNDRLITASGLVDVLW